MPDAVARTDPLGVTGWTDLEAPCAAAVSDCSAALHGWRLEVAAPPTAPQQQLARRLMPRWLP